MMFFVLIVLVNIIKKNIKNIKNPHQDMILKIKRFIFEFCHRDFYDKFHFLILLFFESFDFGVDTQLNRAIDLFSDVCVCVFATEATTTRNQGTRNATKYENNIICCSSSIGTACRE